MSIFSRIFGLQSKSVDKTESGSPEIIRLKEFEKELCKLLGKDVYLARSDYKPLCTDYKDLYEQFSTLKKSKTLEYFCSQNHVDVQQIESFIETFKDLSKQKSTEIITLHNRSFLEEDYMLVIAGAGAGKTATIAAKVKYLVEKKHIEPDQILVISFTNKAVGELQSKINKALKINCPVTTFHKTGYAILRRQEEDRKLIVNGGFMFNVISN